MAMNGDTPVGATVTTFGHDVAAVAGDVRGQMGHEFGSHHCCVATANSSITGAMVPDGMKARDRSCMSTDQAIQEDFRPGLPDRLNVRVGRPTPTLPSRAGRDTNGR